MYYLKILVGEASYHGVEALTYSCEELLVSGVLVSVPLRGKKVIGVVVGTTNKPRFAVKNVLGVSPLPPMPDKTLRMIEWIFAYYPAPLGIITQLFLPRSLPTGTGQSIIENTPELSSLPPLTPDQAQVLTNIIGPGLHILHGETGSGKTRVYVELAKRQMELGASSLILTPEIGLTSQLLSDFKKTFREDQLVLIHSEIGTTEKRNTWAKILCSQQPLIIIGARSALFAPIRNLGLIVVDESHEPSYKQDQAPHYHASSVAAQLARLHQAILVLGSATPLISDYYIAELKKRPILRMQQTATQTSKPLDHSVHIIDLRNKQLFNKSAFIGDELLEATQMTLQTGEQVLLFLNRRGTARLVFCERCGWQALCPHCDIPLVYHGDTHSMRCHSCSHQADTPMECPTCQNTSIVFKSLGTKALEQEVRRLFPGARIQRFDTDNKRADKIGSHYHNVRNGNIDILVGTQTLAKGLDLPKLGLVGVITADTGLFFPDFSSEERTFQLITQVIGRVGRGHRATKAIVQTYNPESPILRAILEKNWGLFYNKELIERKKFLFPPFCYLLKLTCRRASREAAERAAHKVIETIRTKFTDIIIEGPAPSFHERIQDKYQWQIIIKTKKRGILLDIIKNLPANCSFDIDPLNLL